MALNSKLPEFLRAKAAQQFALGFNDCGLWLAEWVSVATGCADLASALRGRYATEQECRAMFGRRAPLRQGSILDEAGLRRTTDPLPGDVAFIAIRTPEGRSIVGAIRVARGWATLAPRGLSCVPSDQARVLRAWRVEEIECPPSSLPSPLRGPISAP